MTFSASYTDARRKVAPVQVQCLVMRAAPDDDDGSRFTFDIALIIEGRTSDSVKGTFEAKNEDAARADVYRRAIDLLGSRLADILQLAREGGLTISMLGEKP